MEDFASLGVPVIEHYARAGVLDVVNIDKCVDEDALHDDLKRAVAPQIVRSVRARSARVSIISLFHVSIT